MMRLESRVRRGVTLVELLVVMAVITALAALALLIAPSIANQDNTLKGTGDVQAALKIAQGMAGAARQPRGVRLLSPSAAVPAGSPIATELQYLESPPVMVSDPNVLVSGISGPQVQFNYTTNSAGAITTRQCLITGLTQDQIPQIVGGATLVLPTINSFSRISSFNTSTNEAVLDVYPDAAIGAGTSFRTYHFGVYGIPRPLLGEPTLELPLNIGVDLALSQPASSVPTNYDIMFAPSGQRIATSSVPSSSSQVFLWVRDYTKVSNMTPTATNPWTFNPALFQFQKGGEQQIVGIRAAAVGTAPVLWPDLGTGTYSTSPVQDPYTFARDKLSGP